MKEKAAVVCVCGGIGLEKITQQGENPKAFTVT